MPLYIPKQMQNVHRATYLYLLCVSVHLIRLPPLDPSIPISSLRFDKLSPWDKFHAATPCEFITSTIWRQIKQLKYCALCFPAGRDVFLCDKWSLAWGSASLGLGLHGGPAPSLPVCLSGCLGLQPLRVWTPLPPPQPPPRGRRPHALPLASRTLPKGCEEIKEDKINGCV